MNNPLAYEFFRHGLLAAALAGALCGLMGVPVVLKRMSYIGHGLSHAIFGGAVVSYVAGINFYLGAGAWGVLASWLIRYTARRRPIGADAAIGIVTTASFAIGVALLTHVHHFTQNFEAALFGNILGVDEVDLWVLAGVLLVSVAAILLGYRSLLFTLFDEEVAATHGVPTEAVSGLLSLLLAATLIATMRIMGVTLIAAVLVIPAATARLLTSSFARMLWLAPVLGTVCGVAGMVLSWYLDAASGATIVLFSAAMFATVAATRPASQRSIQIPI